MRIIYSDLSCIDADGLIPTQLLVLLLWGAAHCIQQILGHQSIKVVTYYLTLQA